MYSRSFLIIFAAKKRKEKKASIPYSSGGLPAAVHTEKDEEKRRQIFELTRSMNLSFFDDLTINGVVSGHSENGKEKMGKEKGGIKNVGKTRGLGR